MVKKKNLIINSIFDSASLLFKLVYISDIFILSNSLNLFQKILKNINNKEIYYLFIIGFILNSKLHLLDEIV